MIAASAWRLSNCQSFVTAATWLSSLLRLYSPVERHDPTILSKLEINDLSNGLPRRLDPVNCDGFPETIGTSVE